MKFSEAWLREWVSPDASTEALGHELTMAGLEVDGIEPVAAEFTGVVVGAVLKVESHPDADKLRVCQVDVADGEPLTIVCGAANVREGLKVPCAKVGAVLPGNFKIKKAKLRGVPSFGMLCSVAELGMAEQAEGLLELPDDLETGADIRDALNLNDSMIELGITPNRGDCLGMVGIAREVGVMYRCDVSGPDMAAVPAAIDDVIGVEIRAPERCARYVGRVIKGINPKAQTPLWMQERLRRSGVRSLGPVVDVTNYVLLELGQPMHAFDLGQLSGGIQVRYATQGEKLELLDGQTIELKDSALVIADQNKALALAGIMGGAASAVSDSTDSIFLESAYFDPILIAGHARSYGLHTDSSHRFERGVSAELQALAIERATALLLPIIGGQAGPLIESVHEAHLPARPDVTLRASQLRKVLGFDVPSDEVTDILSRLGLNPTVTSDSWTVVPPAYRFDIEIEVDLIEEVSRIVGYDKLPVTQTIGELTLGSEVEGAVGSDRVADALVARGYQEAITYSFVDPEVQQWLCPDVDSIALTNPISAELSVMRTSLLPGLCMALQYNIHRQQSRVRFFETGLQFVKNDGEIQQDRMIAGIVAGTVNPEQWGESMQGTDFFDAKADVEALLQLGGNANTFDFVAGTHSALHPGQTAMITHDGRSIGCVGTLHPRVTKKLDLPANSVYFEIELACLGDGHVPAFEALSKFPAIRRDIAVVVDESVAANDLLTCIHADGNKILQDVEIFDVYVGKGVENGRKSLALGLILQETSRTLTDEEVESFIQGILHALEKNFGATLRD